MLAAMSQYAQCGVKVRVLQMRATLGDRVGKPGELKAFASHAEVGGPLQSPTNHVRAAQFGRFGITLDMCLFPNHVLLRGLAILHGIT